jgi:hypothetical protein
MARTSLAYRPHLLILEARTLLSGCHVTRLGDGIAGIGSRGTLRYCISQANQIGGPATIDFKVTGTIHLTSSLPTLAADITIVGPGANLLIISGPGQAGFDCTAFRVDGAATVTISGVTATNCVNEVGPGGVLNYGSLTLVDSAVTNNETLFGTDAAGGGVMNFGTMTISGSTVSGNLDDPDGVGKGGGIYNAGSGVMLIENSTVSGNEVLYGHGGGVYNAGWLDVRFSTVTQNYANCGDGWGIYSSGPHLGLYDTIVAGNKGCDSGNDLIGSYTGSSDLIGGDPKLGPLADNGGPTQTNALLPGSPAIDAGDNTGAPMWDQRGPGYPRIVNGTIDIGAFEAQNTGAPATRGSRALAAAVAQDVRLRLLRRWVFAAETKVADGVDTRQPF